jgi:antitoxin ParD1/3/4
MTISLTPEQQAWIAAHVARGEFPSIDAAALQLIDERIAERDIEGDDLAWAKPHVDAALSEVARGDVIGRDEHRARNAARLAALKG